MKYDKLKARGFVGVKKGLGLDEIEIDFSNLSGLIALSGPNGAGKSTCMELLSPFRKFASRGQSFQHHVFLRDAFRDLSFWFNGSHYRTGKEVLDIVVIREDGTEVLLENLSGGEKVWSLKALRLAMTLISKEKSGRNFLTVLADEEDGALDVDNARHFIDLYRSFMAEGGFEDCIFISHKPECVGMADHVIEFRKGGVTVQ